MPVLLHPFGSFTEHDIVTESPRRLLTLENARVI